ncbi:MAG: recombinase family protein [Eubacteriaceae bacterium]
MKTAIYARQSIDKKDSVSIDAQIEFCVKLCDLNNWEYVIYKDAGFSGKNLKRPDFEKMLNAIEQCKINRVIAYRLDRISRSLSDFANLIKHFEEKDVQFMSATENFDTNSPIGRAMVYIVMVFAQLERETITQRVTDSYFFRAKEGRFVGGNTPYGYKGTKVIKDGKNISVFGIDPSQSDVLKLMYEKYNSGYSIRKVTDYLNENKIPSPTGKRWLANVVGRILRHPASVENTPDIYYYFKTLGYVISNPPSEYNGSNGVLIFGKEKGKDNRIKMSISDQIVVIGDHPPIITAKMWLTAQYRLNKNKQSKRLGTGLSTWLTGLTKCNLCGHSITAKVTIKNNKRYTYLVCRGRSNSGNSFCDNNTYYKAEEIENEVLNQMLVKINEYDFLENNDMEVEDVELTVEKNKLLAKVYEIDNIIDNLIDQLGKGLATVDKHINNKINKLDIERQSLVSKIDNIDSEILAKNSHIDIQSIKKASYNIKYNWHELNVSEKSNLASTLIQQINIDNNGTIQIKWVI